ncbi:flavoprotein [Streptomyces sp. NBC_01615]|uniref:flavoprotein n=1 Tax=Streptomyces sp. NBC_01615 TaxID=2975898 RepID=UPI0038708BA8
MPLTKPTLSLGTAREATSEPHDAQQRKQSRDRTGRGEHGRSDFRAAPVRAAGQGCWPSLRLLPTTADILGKAAHSIADDLLSTAILASPRPVVFAPAMNPAMWDSPAVRRNVAQLAADGHHMLPMRPITSVTTGEFDTGLGPTPESVMPHLWHMLMRQLKNDYWAEATATPPAAPAEIKQSTNSQGAKALPLLPHLPPLTADASDAPSASAIPSGSPDTSDT